MTDNEKYAEKYPHLFRTTKFGNKLVQMQLIVKKDVDDYNAITTDVPALNHLLDKMREKISYRRCYGERDGCDNFPVDAVQDLLDYAYIATQRLNIMKKSAVEHGIAEYTSEGKFQMKEDSDES